MPLYDYKCSEHEFTRFLPLARYREAQVCDCGKPAERVIKPTMVAGDIAPYTSPVDGRVINSRSARREDLLRSGCVEYDPGIGAAGDRERARSSDRLDAAVEDTIEGELARMPARKRELLEQEMRAGVSPELVRKSA